MKHGTNTRRSMKKALIVLMVLLMASSLAFAKGTAEQAAADEPSGSLVIYTSYSNDLQRILIDTFREKYPKIDVQLVEGGAGELKARSRLRQPILRATSSPASPTRISMR